MKWGRCTARGRLRRLRSGTGGTVGTIISLFTPPVRDQTTFCSNGLNSPTCPTAPVFLSVACVRASATGPLLLAPSADALVFGTPVFALTRYAVASGRFNAGLYGAAQPRHAPHPGALAARPAGKRPCAIVRAPFAAPARKMSAYIAFFSSRGLRSAAAAWDTATASLAALMLGCTRLSF